MNIASTAAARSTSRFVEHLRTLSGTGGRGRVGFHAHAEAPKRHVGLVASLDRGADLSLIRQLVQAGADAVEVTVRDRAAMTALRTAGSAVDVPLGIVSRIDVDDDLAGDAAEAGIDWIRLELEAPLMALGWERPSRFLTVPLDVDLRIAGALNAPFVEAVVITAPQNEMWSQQIVEGLRVRTLSEGVKKPFLVAVSDNDPVLSGEVCAALGIDAVLVSVDGPSGAEHVAAYVAQLHAVTRERPLRADAVT
jgi:hypothetical protein